jgi:hypothetical protein
MWRRPRCGVDSPPPRVRVASGGEHCSCRPFSVCMHGPPLSAMSSGGAVYLTGTGRVTSCIANTPFLGGSRAGGACACSGEWHSCPCCCRACASLAQPSVARTYSSGAHRGQTVRRGERVYSGYNACAPLAPRSDRPVCMSIIITPCLHKSFRLPMRQEQSI